MHDALFYVKYYVYIAAYLTSLPSSSYFPGAIAVYTHTIAIIKVLIRDDALFSR